MFVGVHEHERCETVRLLRHMAARLIGKPHVSGRYKYWFYHYD
jgi:hypothetical protein